MNVLQKVALRLAGFKGSDITAYENAGRSYSLQDHEFGKALGRLWGTTTHSGKAVTSITSMEVTAFWACVRVLSETIGGMPWGVYERDALSGNITPIDHDLGMVLQDSPNADMDQVGLKEAITANLAQRGNAFSFVDKRADGYPYSIYPIESGRVTPGRLRDGTIVYDVNDRGKWTTYPREKIWHVKGFGMNGLVGLSPMDYGRQALGISMASEEFQAKFFANGASPSFIVSVPQWLTEPQRKIARDNLEQLWGGMDNAHKARLLEGGMKPENGTMPLHEAQFHELRGFSITEVCRLMRVQPHLIMDLSRSTNNNIEQQSLEFVMFTCMPYTTRLENSISRWLIPPQDRRRLKVRFNLDSLLRADSAARGNLLGSMVQNGILSRNEARAFEGKNRSDDPAMDEFTAQTNLAPIDMLRKLANATATKPAPTMPPLGKEALHLTVVNERGNTKHDTFNLLQLPDNTINVVPSDVHVDVKATEVRGGDVTVAAPDQTKFAEVLATMGQMLVEMRKGQQEDTEVRKQILERAKALGDAS